MPRPPPGRGLSDSSEKDKQSGAAQKLRLGRLPPERLPNPQSGLSGLDGPPQTACSGLRPQRVRRARTPGAVRCGPDPVAPGAVRTQAHLDRAAQLFLLTDMPPDRRASRRLRAAPRPSCGAGRLTWPLILGCALTAAPPAASDRPAGGVVADRASPVPTLASRVAAPRDRQTDGPADRRPGRAR